MKKSFKKIILKSTGATDLYELEEIQSLWSGYGKILRYGLEGSKIKSVVVKDVRMPTKNNHPRGWNSDISHNRKVKSYKVEMAWYKLWSDKCGSGCKIPHCYALESEGDEVLMVMEDLDASGYPLRKSSLSWEEMKGCISWLANFHGTFLGAEPDKLWKVGTYWHLDTRPDELKVLEDETLKKAAHAIDLKLKQAKFKTFVHGDAKLANFCFSNDGKVAAVDFQYVGGGCGMKDLAYFVGSCLYEDECESLEKEILDYYFMEIKKVIEEQQKDVDYQALEKEWRELYPLAWTDFHRFLKGWSPGHWKINSYSERVTREVVEQLKKEKGK